MAGIIVNPNTTFDGRPIFCQLVCDYCHAIYCGGWRNDWISKPCRECDKGRATPLIEYEICKTVFEPSGDKLN